jgi:hypothetical protein
MRSNGPWMVAMPPTELGGTIWFLGWGLRPDGLASRTQSLANSRRFDTEGQAIRFVEKNREWFANLGNPRVINVHRLRLTNSIPHDPDVSTDAG